MLTKGWANQHTDSCCISSRPGVRGLFSASCIEGSSLDARGCSAATLSRYYFILPRLMTMDSHTEDTDAMERILARPRAYSN